MPAIWTNAEIELVAERAYQLHLQGKHQDAIAIFEGLLAIDPRNLYCLEALAALSLKVGSPENAIDYANRALAFSPHQVEALACRCEANIVLNFLPAARRDLELLRSLQGARTDIARLAMRIGNAEKFASEPLLEATPKELDR